jgi:hypothetical protein
VRDVSDAIDPTGVLMPLERSFSQFVTSLVLAGSLACGASTAVTGNTPTTTEVLVDNEFELSVGQSAALTALGLTVQFDSVAGDSRCPRNVTCIWAGNAAVLVTPKRSGAIAYQAKLNSLVEPNSVTDGSDTLTLVGLAPEPDTRHPIAHGDYRARFVVHSRP